MLVQERKLRDQQRSVLELESKRDQLAVKQKMMKDTMRPLLPRLTEMLGHNPSPKDMKPEVEDVLKGRTTELAQLEDSRAVVAAKQSNLGGRIQATETTIQSHTVRSPVCLQGPPWLLALAC